jgi:hypothetical protein
MNFPLRLVDINAPRLPLQPHFIHFEDPEHNRLLTSQAATANLSFQEQKDDAADLVMRTLTLATDRAEYNSNSRLAFRFDWDDGRLDNHRSVTLRFRRIESGSNVPIPLKHNPPLASLQPGRLFQISLHDLERDNPPADTAVKPALRPDDVLELTLRQTVRVGTGPTGDVTEVKEVVLSLNIVAQPVLPSPEAAYALLRQQIVNGIEQVECVRFAWAPTPTDIQIVCARDLRTGVVRRRAVFQWHDTARPGNNGRHVVQKITQTGATHEPFVA